MGLCSNANSELEKRLKRILSADLRPEILFLSAAAFLCSAVFTVAGVQGFWVDSGIPPLAIIIDLSVGLPVLGYFFLVRPRKANRLVLVPLSLFGMLLAWWWIPESHRDPSTFFEVAVALVEGAILVTVILRIRRIRRIYRAEQERQPYPIDAARIALSETLGKRLGGALLNEVAILWYAFAGWRGVREDRLQGVAFPVHRRKGYPAILGAVILAVVVETAVLHLLLSMWIGWVAWIVTGLGIYSLLWILGDFHAARHNPTLLTADYLHLRTGLRWQADVGLEEAVGILSEEPTEKHVKMAMFGAPDFWLEFHDSVLVHGLFGIEREVRFIGVGVDDPDRFREDVTGRVDPGLGLTGTD